MRSSAITNARTFDADGWHTVLVTEGVQRDDVVGYPLALGKHRCTYTNSNQWNANAHMIYARNIDTGDRQHRHYHTVRRRSARSLVPSMMIHNFGKLSGTVDSIEVGCAAAFATRLCTHKSDDRDEEHEFTVFGKFTLDPSTA